MDELRLAAIIADYFRIPVSTVLAWAAHEFRAGAELALRDRRWQ